MKTIETKETENSGTKASSHKLKEFIAELPFLRGLSESHLQALMDCAMPQEFREGETIFREGDPANRFYLILEGEVALESENGDETAVLIEKIGVGDVLGWSWLFPPYYWHFTARTTKRTKAVFFYGTRIRQLCDEDPVLGCELMKRIAAVVIERLQATRKELLELTHRRR